MKKILLILIVCLFLLGCEEQGLPLTKKEIKNPYAPYTVLILSRSTDYKNKLSENISSRLAHRYSFTIDDIDKIYDYNFIDFHKVVIIENGATTLENYFKDFTGRNNIILVAICSSPLTPNIPVDYLVTSGNVGNVENDANILISKIRKN